MKTEQELLISGSYKLYESGLRSDTFTKGKAYRILRQTVAPGVWRRMLERHLSTEWITQLKLIEELES